MCYHRGSPLIRVTRSWCTSTVGAKMSTTTTCVRVLICVYLVLFVSAVVDVCDRCQCLPAGPKPTQALCTDNTADNKVFEVFMTEESQTLKLVYIFNMISVTLLENSLVSYNPLTLLIQNCSHVYIANNAVPRLRTLIIREAQSVQVADIAGEDLWALFLENIQQLEITSRSLTARYSVTIGRIGSLTLLYSQLDHCGVDTDFRFLLFNSKVQHVPTGGLALCGGKEITINGNTFARIEEQGIQITSEGTVAVVFNRFENITKLTFNISAPEIHITKNHFQLLPAAALRGVTTYGDTFFTNNTIEEIDLGGVLLDMGMDMTVEENVIDCDCASRTTSILNPKEDMVILTNSSLEKLDAIFLNNFCNLNCTLTLKDFSIALKSTEVCLTNETQLEEDVLCHRTTVMEIDSYSTTEVTTDYSQEEESTSYSTTSDHTQEGESTSSSSASKIEIIVPVGLVILTVVLMSLLVYGCREMNTFKYKFNPNQPAKAVNYVS